MSRSRKKKIKLLLFLPEQDLQTFHWTAFRSLRQKFKVLYFTLIFIKSSKILPHTLHCLAFELFIIKERTFILF